MATEMLRHHRPDPQPERRPAQDDLDLWPWTMEFTIALFLPILFWLGFMAGWYASEGLGQ